MAAILLFSISSCTNAPEDQTEMDDPATIAISSDQSANLKKKGFKMNMEKDAVANNNYRKVLYTGEHMQLVLMSLKPGEEIGDEIHLKSDQFFRFESGKGKCTVNETVYEVTSGDIVLVPAGAKHNVINTDATTDFKIYTIYALPNHKDGIIRATRKEADETEAKFDGKLTE
jgi:mannose-6-phosphate isomerase-like protein (cupin superfamily)